MVVGGVGSIAVRGALSCDCSSSSSHWALTLIRSTFAASDLRIVALTGTPAIGAEEPFAAFSQTTINDRGDVAFIGLVNDEQLTGEADADLSVIFGAGMGVWIDELGQQQRNLLMTSAKEAERPEFSRFKRST